MAIVLNDNLNLLAPKPVDNKYGVWELGSWRPFNDTSEVLTSLVFYRYIGLTVSVNTDEGTKEYWFRDGIEDEDLVEKYPNQLLSWTPASGNLDITLGNTVNLDGRYALLSTKILAGTGLTGGGDLSADRTISFDTVWGDNRYALSSHTHSISDITGLQSALNNKVETSTTINGKPLTGNITLDASDVGALTKLLADTYYKPIGWFPDWEDILNVPETFTPSAHTHPISEIDGLQTALDNKEAVFSKGSIIAGTNISITGTLTNRLVGGGDITINSTVPVYPVFNRTDNGVVPAPGGSTSTRYLREDGTWVVPTNTTYSTMSLSALNTGTETTGRLVSAKLLTDWISARTYTKTESDALYAAKVHTHAISDIINLQSTLDSKVNRSNTITSGYGIIASPDFSGPVSLEINTVTLDNRYLRKDSNDSNDLYTLNLGEVITDSATIDNLTLPSLSTTTESNYLVVDSSGIVSKRVFDAMESFDIGDNGGTPQFSIGDSDQLRFAGSGDTSVSFNPTTKTITITSTPGAGGGGVVTSVFGRTGGITAEVGDYSTTLVTEGTNLYFTTNRVLETQLTGLSTSTNSSITSSDTILQALGKLQAQSNTKLASSRTLTVSGTSGRTLVSGGEQDLTQNREWVVDLVASGVTAGTYTKLTVDTYGRATAGASLVEADIPNLSASKITSGTFSTGRIGTGTASAGHYVDGATGAWTPLPSTDLSNYYNKTDIDDFLNNKQDELVSGTNIKTINGATILGSGDIVTPNTTYTAGNGLTLTGTEFSLPITVSGTGTYVQSVTQTANGLTVTLGTPPNTTYTAMSEAEINAGTSTSARTISAQRLNLWLNSKGFLTSVDWTDITNKPATFTPSAHTHSASDITSGVLSIDRIPVGTTSATVASGNHTHTFASITSKPTTISGYGITDAYTKTEVDSALSSKYNTPSGTTSQYVRGDGSLASFPSIPAQFAPVAGTGISLSGTYPNITITNSSPNATHTGDVTGSTALTIASKAVTFAKFQDIPTASLVGRYSSGTGVAQSITLGAGLTLNTTTGVLTASGSGGTITSVGLSLPSIFNVSGSPVTTSGTLTAVLATQSALTVFAGPASGTGTPTFRALLEADIPSLSISKITDLQTSLNAKENSANKATSFTILNNTLYPTTQAVAEYVTSQTPAAQTLSQPAVGQIAISNGNTVNLNTVNMSGNQTGIAGNKTWTGTQTLSTLAGTGSRMVIASSTGVLSTQAIPTVNDGTLTLATGTGLTGSASFSANQSGNATFTVAAASGYAIPTTNKQDEWDAKEPPIAAGTTAQYWRGDKTWATLNKSSVGLGNVDNTSDLNKPISTATAAALNTKQDALVSGTSIKTINGVSILGSGDIVTPNDNTTYTAGSGITLTGTEFSVPVSVTGTGTFVSSIAQTASGIAVTLGTPPNTTYSNMSAAEITAGTSTTGRSISSKVLNDWLNGKNYLTTVAWDDVTDKPTTFTPTAHTHDAGDITSGVLGIARIPTGTTSSTVALGNHTHTFSAITSKPTTLSGYGITDAYTKTEINTSLAGKINTTEKGAANGVATLGADGKILNSQIPSIALTETYVVASQAAMLALSAEIGDVAVRSDLNKSFILQSEPASTLGNWVELLSPSVTNSDQVPEGIINLYFTQARARQSISVSGSLSYNSTTGVISYTTPTSLPPTAHTHNADDINSGTLAIARIPTGTTGSTVALGNHTHATLTRGTGLTGNNYTGATATTWAVAYGTTAGTAAQGNDTRIVNAVQTSRQISTGTGLTGGGDLTANRTLSFDQTWGDARYATNTALNDYERKTKLTFIEASSATAAATVAKVASTIGGNYVPVSGDIIQVTFSLSNTAASATLNIDGSGAYPIQIGGVAAPAVPFSGTKVMFFFDGTAYQLFGSQRTTDTNTTYVSSTLSSVANTAATLTLTINRYTIDNYAAGKTLYTLPGTAAIGSMIEVYANAAGGLRITAPAGDNIIMGEYDSGAAGWIEIQQGTTVRMRSILANTTWIVVDATGEVINNNGDKLWGKGENSSSIFTITSDTTLDWTSGMAYDESGVATDKTWAQTYGNSAFIQRLYFDEEDLVWRDASRQVELSYSGNNISTVRFHSVLGLNKIIITSSGSGAPTGIWVNRGPWVADTYNKGNYVTAPSRDNPSNTSLYFLIGSESYFSSTSPTTDTAKWSEVPIAGLSYTGSTSITLSGDSFQRAALTGDVTAPLNSNSTTIANNAVTFAKMQNIATNTFLGRTTSGTGNIEALTAAQFKTGLGLHAVATSGDYNALINKPTIAAQLNPTAGTGISITGTYPNLTFTNSSPNATHTGEVTGSTALTITNSAVTYAKIQNMVGLSVLGRSANSTGVTAAITAATDGHVLRRSGTTLGFGTIGNASITDLAWSKITSTPTTISGYGIVDANRYTTIITVSANRTVALTDENVYWIVTGNRTLTIPANATVAFPIGARIDIRISDGASGIFTPAGSVTLNHSEGDGTITVEGWKIVSLLKVGINEWDLIGG